MGQKVSQKTLDAYKLLGKPHPRSPSGRHYTLAEAAREGGVLYMTLYYHDKKQKQAAK